MTSVFFLVFPTFDLWFSAQFYESLRGFPMSGLGAFRGVRSLHSILTWIIGLGALLVLLLKIALPTRRSLLPLRDATFILSTLALGPGILVNAIFKSYWGRPRPYTIGFFGGDQPFVGVWEITKYCSRNCSFVSGEASSSAWLLTVAVLVPPDWRPAVLRLMVALGVVFSLNRIAFGAHFLSDVLLSWWMTLALTAIVYRFLYVHAPAALTEQSLDAGLTRLGEALRAIPARFRRPPE